MAVLNKTLESLTIQAFQECNCIESIRKTNSDINAEYFLKLSTEYFCSEHIKKQQPKIIVLGTSLPPEIVFAFTGENPFYVFGGSRAMTDISDNDVPRDTDPVSRSILGYLQAAQHMAKDALVIVPLVSDSQRKLAYILKDQGWTVETVHLPPYAPIGKELYTEELKRLCGVLSFHTKKRFPSYKKSALFMEEVGRAIREFIFMSSKRGDKISGSLQMLVLGSFFMTQDIKTWIKELEKLTAELATFPASRENNAPKMLIIGSPIYFSCYKIPFLLEDIGINLCGYIEPGLSRFAKPRESVKKITHNTIAETQLQYDFAGAHIRNDLLWHTIQKQIKLLNPDGIIWHILKGQIEYDFELLRLEEYFSQMNMPVFRLETDYQYQDVEQLRVRVEAFAELLSHKKAVKK